MGKDAPKLIGMSQPMPAAESSRRSHRTNRWDTLGQGVRRVRPFARLRFSTWRPPVVAMRALNPWVRLRLRLLG